MYKQNLKIEPIIYLKKKSPGEKKDKEFGIITKNDTHNSISQVENFLIHKYNCK